MNIDNLTIAELRGMVELLADYQAKGIIYSQADLDAAVLAGRAPCGGSVGPSTWSHIGKKCIIRTCASGVHFGTIRAHSGQQVDLTNARRLWRFDVAPHGISLSEVSIHGSPGSRSRICAAVQAITLLDAVEIIPCTPEAIESISSAKVYTP